MLLLLLALMADAPAAQEAQATLQSCEMTPNFVPIFWFSKRFGRDKPCFEN